MLTENDYLQYIDAFNAKDYSKLEEYFTDDFILENAGFKIQGKPAFRAFYAFVHNYLEETVVFKSFYPGTDGFVANVIIHFEGLKDLTQSTLDEKGFPGMTAIAKGDSAELEFLIQYLTTPEGLIHYIKGAVWFPEITKS